MYVGSKLNCLADAVFSESRPSAAIMVHGGLYCLSFPLLLGSCCIVNVTVFKVLVLLKLLLSLKLFVTVVVTLTATRVARVMSLLFIFNIDQR